MNNYNYIKINDDKCDKHKKRIFIILFDYNIHLCLVFMKIKKHGYYYKTYIVEVSSENEKLKWI